MKTERILLHEETGHIDKIDRQLAEELPRVRQLVRTYKAIQVLPELTSIYQLERFRADSPAAIERLVRNYIVDQSGTTIGGLVLSREKLMDLVELPPQTKDFVDAVFNANRFLSFDLANYELHGGTVKVNESVVEAKKDQHRWYCSTAAQHKRLAEIQEFADQVNAFAEKFGKGSFARTEIPFLDGGFYPEKAENGFSDTGRYLGRYKPDWRAVANAK